MPHPDRPAKSTTPIRAVEIEALSDVEFVARLTRQPLAAISAQPPSPDLLPAPLRQAYDLFLAPYDARLPN
jgi:hypothetical protein